MGSYSEVQQLTSQARRSFHGVISLSRLIQDYFSISMAWIKVFSKAG
jgi:hypothetical protein